MTSISGSRSAAIERRQQRVEDGDHGGGERARRRSSRLDAPGTIQAATSSASVARSHETRSRIGPMLRALRGPAPPSRRSSSSSSRHALTRPGHGMPSRRSRRRWRRLGQRRRGIEPRRDDVRDDDRDDHERRQLQRRRPAGTASRGATRRAAGRASRRSSRRSPSPRRRSSSSPGRCERAIPPTAPMNMPGNTGPPRKPLSASE